MRRACLIFVVTSAMLLGAWTRAETPRKRLGVLETPWSALLAPAKSRDRAELSRVAARIGVARLGQALVHDDGEIRLAALQALPFLPQAILLLPYLPPLVLSGPAVQRGQAIQTLADLLPIVDAERLAEWEIPKETTVATCKALAAAAADATLGIPSRTLALATLGASRMACGAQDHSPLFADRDAAIRRAAILASAPGDANLLAALHAAARDPAPTVVAAAGARLCRNKLGLPEPKDLWQRMVKAKETAAEDLVDIVPCLADGSSDDKAALVFLRSHPSASVREAAQATAKIDMK